MTTPVPPQAPYQVSIAGHNYQVDTEFKPYLRDAFRHRSIASQREAIDLTNEPGEGTVNTADLWRRGQNNWVLGAGQPYLDRKKSSATRFWNCRGVETSLTWQLSMLPRAVKRFTCSDTTHVNLLVVGNRIYVRENNTIKYTKSTETPRWTWIDVAGAPGTDWQDWTTNGTTVFLAYTTDGIYRIPYTQPATMHQFAHTADVGVTFVGWAATYLFASRGPDLWGGGGTYTIRGPTTPTAPTYTSGTPSKVPPLPATKLWTNPTPTWVWNDCCFGNSEIYFSGYPSETGSTGGIFRSTITTLGKNIMVPSEALPFEGGERPYKLLSYLNYIFVGTNLGVRMCRTISEYDPTGKQGNLESGAIVPNLFQKVPLPVYGLAGHGRFVYFTWSKFNRTRTEGGSGSGLGRLDLTNFVDELTPAYVSDMMSDHEMISVDCGYITWPGTQITTPPTGYSSPLLALEGGTAPGIYANTPTKYATQAWVESGYITYGIPDEKVALQLSVRSQPTKTDDPLGQIFGYVSVTKQLSNAYTYMGTTKTTINPKWAFQLRGEQYQVRINFEAGTAGTEETPIPTTPVLNRWILKAYPAIVSGTTIIVPITLARTVLEQGLYRAVDPYAELAYLQTIRQSQTIVKYVEGPFTATVIITTLDWIPFQEQGNAGNRRGYEGTLVVYLKTFPTSTTS